jgi:hypothetical protein
VHTPRHSGAETLVRELCIIHQARGIDTAITSFSPSDPDFLLSIAHLQTAGVQLFLPERTLAGVDRIRAFRRVYRDFRPQLVYGHSVLPSLYGRLALPLFGNQPRFVSVLHSATNDDYEEANLWGAELLLARRNHRVFAVSEEGASNYRKRIPYAPMEHLRRGDDWTNLLQKIGLTLFPLNPVLFWAERRLCAERELACDDRVLRSRCTRKAYAMCLTRLAEDSVIRRRVSLALGAWERRSELVSRVQRLLMHPGKSMSGSQTVMVTGSLMLAIFGGALALARSPQLVAFAAFNHSETQAPGFREASFEGTSIRGAKAVEAGGSLQLVKAVMPQPAAQSTMKLKPPRRHVAKQAIKPRMAQGRQAWFVLTDWNESLPPARLVIAVAPGDRNTYAAVPIAHGWLILQI